MRHDAWTLPGATPETLQARSPIEEVIAARAGARVTRREIVEVSHFAVAPSA